MILCRKRIWEKQGFDKLSPNGEDIHSFIPQTPFGLSLSKACLFFFSASL